MNRLFDRLKAEGCVLSISDDGRDTELTFDSITVVIGVREYVRQSPRELTAEEKASLRLDPDAYVYNRTEYNPTGKLVPFVEVMAAYGRRECADSKFINEAVLFNAFVKRLKDAVEWRRRFDARWAEAEKQRQEEKRLRDEAEQRRKEEQERIDQLKDIMRDWQFARTVDQFLQAIRSHYHEANVDISVDSRLGRWMTWAEGHAITINPLLNGIVPAPVLQDVGKYPK